MADDESDRISEIMTAVRVDSSLGLGRLTQHDGNKTSLLRSLRQLGLGDLWLKPQAIDPPLLRSESQEDRKMFWPSSCGLSATGSLQASLITASRSPVHRSGTDT